MKKKIPSPKGDEDEVRMQNAFDTHSALVNAPRQQTVRPQAKEHVIISEVEREA